MSTLSRQDKKFYIVVLLTLCIMLFFGYLPPFGQITPEGMKLLGIFIGCLFAWIFGEIVWSSLLAIVIMIVYDFGTMADNYAAAYGNNTISIMVTSIVFCYSIEKSGLLSEVSRWIVGQRWAQKSPWMLVFAFNLAAMLGAILTGNFVPPLILLWALFYELAREINVKPFDTYSNLILCSIAVAACTGTATMPYTGMPVIVKGMAQTFVNGFEYNVAEYLILNFLLCVLYLVLSLFILKIFFGRKVKHVVIPKRDSYKMNLNTESKISLFFLILVVLVLIVPNFLPSDNFIRDLFNNKLTVSGVFMLGAAILMCIRVKGKPVLDIAEGLSHMQWPLFLLVATALCISNYLTMDEFGIVPTIVSALNPLMEGKSAFAVTMIFIAIGLILTNFINDMATIFILFPIAAQFVVDAGGSIMLLAVLFGQATIQGCLMPSGSILGAMLHGNTDWLKPTDVFKYVGIMEIVVLLSLMTVTLMGNVIGL